MKRSIPLGIFAAAASIAVASVPFAGASTREGQITYAMHVTIAPAWFDPAENTGIATPFMVQEALHDAIAKPMPQNAMAPSLAESWTESPDGLSYDFVLRKSVVFHNGEPLTADDVKFSFERYRGAGAKILKTKVKAVQVVTPQRLRFVLNEPWPDFLTFYATPATGAGWIVPKRYVEQVGDEGFKKHPIGAGPYKFVSHQPGVELILEAHERYWRKSPSVKRLVMKVVPDESTRLAMLKRGEADIAYLISGALAEEARRTPNIRLIVSGGQWVPAVLREAGYPNGFDAGEMVGTVQYAGAAEAVLNYFGAVGIRARFRTMERAAYLTAQREKKLKNLLFCGAGGYGNAATRIENYLISSGSFAYGAVPDIDDLFAQQARERDARRRGALLHRIQQLAAERVLYLPLYMLSFHNGVGPRVQESSLGRIPLHYYTAPFEDIRLKDP